MNIRGEKQGIELLERGILRRAEMSEKELSHDLEKIRLMRRNLYDYAVYFKKDEQIKSLLVDEHENYCKFIYKTLTTRKMSEEFFEDIVEKFSKDYKLVTQIDQDKSMFDLQIRLLSQVEENCVQREGRGVSKIKEILQSVSGRESERN